jgi:parallel beta-helix repeat protein
MVNDSLVQNNHSHDNRDSGVALYEAYNNTVRDNQLANNALAAIRLTVGASNNLIESNTLTGLAANASGAGYAVYTAGKGSDIPLSGNGRPANNTFRANQITGFKTPVLRIEEADGTRFESNTVTGPGTGFELILGTGNVVEATTFGGGLTTHVAVSGASGQAATATLRDSQIGQILNVQLDSWSTLTLEDRRNLIWQLPVSGLATHAQPALSTLTLTTATVGTTEAFTTLDFAVRPGSGTADVRPTGWQTAAPFAKSWTASAAAGTVLNNSVGNLQPGACYAVSVDGTPLGQFMADGGGRIAFARTAGASPAQYSVAGVACDGSSPPTATPTSTPTATVTPAPSATQTPTSTPPGAPSPTSAPGTTATPTPTGTPVGAPRDQRTYLPEIVR